MPNTNDFHGAKNILFDNEDWMVVDPLDYDSFVYYAPENYKDKWNEYRDGDTYFVIDKDKEPIQTSIIHKEDGKIEYYGSEAQKHRGLSRFEFESNLPDEVKSVVGEIIGHSDIYKLLVKVMSGEEVSSRSMENADELVYDFKFNKSNPAKSLVRISFSDMDEYVKLFDLDDDDKWFIDMMFSSYDSYEFQDSSYASDEWLEGYLIGWFNDENRAKFREIVSLVAPQYANLSSDDEEREASKLLDEMFPREIENIYDDWVSEYNACKNRAGKESVIQDLCGVFNNYGIVEKTCFSDYYTTVGILVSLYKQEKDTTFSISEVLSSILKRKDYGNWYEYMYEIECYDFDYDSFHNWTERQLDKIYEKLEDSDEFTNVKEYSRIYSEVQKKYPKDNRNTTKSGKEFFFRGVDPKNNRILVQVATKDGWQDRSYSEDEFNNFIVSPELFESKKRRKVISEQTTGDESVKFITNLSKIDPTVFNTKKPLMFLQNKLSEYNSKNPGINLNMDTLIKQLSSPSSPFKFTTFNIQTYEPKRVSTLDVNLKNIGFTLTKSNIDPMTIQGGVKLKF